jgi:DNA-binding NarL/FixJ family response regulator
MSLRIAMVEDDAQVTAAISAMIAGGSGIELAWSAATLAEARHCMQRGCDVVLLDLGLPDGRGTQLLPALRALRPAPAVVAFTVFDDEASVIEAVAAGVDGYVLKHTDPQSLLDTLQHAVAGESPISPAVAGYLLRRLRHTEQSGAARPTAAKPDKLMSLTPRERDVLEALARGHSYRDAARLLGMQPGTVSHHVKSLYPKLAATSRSEAIYRAVRDGIISLDE